MYLLLIEQMKKPPEKTLPTDIQKLLQSLKDNKDKICGELEVTDELDKMFQGFSLPLECFMNILLCQTNYAKAEMLLDYLHQQHSEQVLASFLALLERGNRNLYNLIVGHASKNEILSSLKLNSKIM